MSRFFYLITAMLFSLPVSSMAGISLTPVGTYETGVFEDGAAEIVAYDPATESVFVINANASVVDVLSIADPSNPTLTFSIDVSADLLANEGFGSGGVNSVDVKNGVVAVATENTDPTQNGYLVFYDTAGAYLGFVNVGVLPDAVKFSPDGKKLVVANEGEPVEDDNGNLIANPPGSISVVNISGGVPAATVATLGFSAFDGREAEFTNKGLRLQGGVPMSLELEPEFPAISPDGKQAFVTLQEANAFAVVDLVTPKIVDILPEGWKDHSTGQPRLDLFKFDDLPLIGVDAKKLKINLGGFSGLHYEGSGRKGVLKFLTVSDRGPNGADVVNGSRTFNLPGYQARVIAFEVGGKNNNGHGGPGHGRTNNGNHGDKGEAKITKTILLTRADGKTPITGLPNIPGFDEIPVDAKGKPVKYDRFGADLEGIVRDPDDNSLWMVDEYRPSIYHFTDRGRMIVRLVPENTHLLGDAALKQAQFGPNANSPGFYGTETLPEVYSKRRSNRGFEAVALDPEKRLLYAFIQSPMENPDASTHGSHVLRILAVDVDGSSPNYLHPVAEYVYLLERPVHTPDDVDKIGDAVFIGEDKFLVVERDSALVSTGKKFIFEIDLKGATDIRNLPIADESSSGTLEQQSADELAALGIHPVFKRKVLNLPSLGYLPSDKTEGITVLPDGRIAVMNDNDFGIEASKGFKPALGLVTFSAGNMLDASDEDSAVNIANWPVLGMYQSDGIDKYTYKGATYYVTANEGDTRDFDFFSEEERVKDLTLDTDAFPDADDLQEDENIGRLKTTNVIGDIDDDGDNDRIFTFGARSFSIWDSFGNLVYDSSDDFENITADTFPAQFNADNTDNDSFDSRSDDKGPEPEGVVVGKVGFKVYAFIGLERISGIMIYDITNPASPRFVDYVNNRNFNVDAQNPDDSSNPLAGDLGPEGLFFVPSSDSPNGKALLIVGNEISGTTTVYQIGN